MASFRDFDPYVLPFVAGAPAPAIEDALRQAAIEFCQRTYCIYEEQAPIKVPARATLEIEAQTSSDLEPYAVFDIWTADKQLVKATRPLLAERYPTGWQDETVATIADLWGYMSQSETTIRLIPYLSTAHDTKELRITLSMRPTKTATTLPDLLYTRWAKEIAAGALAELHGHANVPYAEGGRVATFMSKFNSAISYAADQVEAGLNKPMLRTGLDVFP